MKQYIDKAAVMAEIKGLIRENELYLSESYTDEIRFQKVGAYSALNDLLHFLNTLEVKEVDLNREIEKEIETRWRGEYLFTSKFKESAKHFFELGLKAQKGE